MMEPLAIRASVSIPGPSVSEILCFPSIDKTRGFLGEVLARQGNVEPVNSFSYTSSQFTDDNELKYNLGQMSI